MPVVCVVKVDDDREKKLLISQPLMLSVVVVVAVPVISMALKPTHLEVSGLAVSLMV